MKKKGFTLIELLAIIVILAIIALIAVPVVLNIIDKAKVSSYERSSENVLEAARLYYNESILDKDMVISETENVYDKVINNLSGDTPDEGSKIYINKEGQIALALKYGNNCYVKNYSEKSFTRTEDGETCTITPAEPTISYKCRKATELHTEECRQTSTSAFCSKAGYTPDGSKGTTTITYGNLGTSGEEPVSGDAFDCDVDGTGYNHRFYYVTEFTSNNEEYAVLVYSNNTTNGVADNSSSSLISYYSESYENWHGPVDAITNLPTVKQWTNISLSNTIRAIKTEIGTNSTTDGGTLPTAFSYTKTVDGETVPLAARLLTYQEVTAACGENITSIGVLDGCNYLLENTKYSSSSLGTYGYWLETPETSNSYNVLAVYGDYRRVQGNVAFNADNVGVRPAIEVLKSEISY